MRVRDSKKMSHLKQILAIFLLGLMLFIPSISALTTSTFTKDEVKSLDRITSFGTYKIEASAWYDPLQIWTKKTIKEIELKTNLVERFK